MFIDSDILQNAGGLVQTEPSTLALRITRMWCKAEQMSNRQLA